MSRSYKHTPVYKGDKDRFAKRWQIEEFVEDQN